MASSSTGTLSPWERLPDELLLRVLEHVMMDPEDGELEWCGPVRGVSPRWRAIHDATCTWLRVRNGVTDEGMHAMCGRLPALTWLKLAGVRSLSVDELGAVGGLTALTHLHLSSCSNVTDTVLRELRGLTKLTKLRLYNCSHVTDVGLRALRGLPALTDLELSYFPNVTNVGLQELRGLTELTRLSLLRSCIQVTDAGLRALRGPTKLTALSLYGFSKVTLSLTALTELNVYDCSTTRRGGTRSGLPCPPSPSVYSRAAPRHRLHFRCECHS